MDSVFTCEHFPSPDCKMHSRDACVAEAMTQYDLNQWEIFDISDPKDVAESSHVRTIVLACVLGGAREGEQRARRSSVRAHTRAGGPPSA